MHRNKSSGEKPTSFWSLAFGSFPESVAEVTHGSTVSPGKSESDDSV
jgi:hypothetical protein